MPAVEPTIKLLQKRDKLESEVLIAEEQVRVIKNRVGYAVDHSKAKRLMLKAFLDRNNMQANRVKF